MERVASALEYGQNWKSMLQKLADAESLVDVYLCTGAYGHSEDREKMVSETHGVRIIYVGDDYFIVGPRRPVHSSIIPMGWISMVLVHSELDTEEILLLSPDDDCIEPDEEILSE